MAGKTVVILGGGSGGSVAADGLRRRLGREHRVVVVDRSEHYFFAPSFLWVMLGQRRPEAITRPLPRLRRKGIDFVQSEVRGLDPAARRVLTAGGDLPYDYLVISLGAETDMGAVPGLKEAAHDLYSLDGVQRLRDALPAFRGGRVVVLVARMPYKCPAAPWEAALLLEAHFKGRGLRDKVQIDAYTPEPQPMPSTGPAVGQMVRQLLEGRGIGFHPKSTVKLVDAAARKIEFEGGEAVPFDLLAAIPPHRCPQVVREAGLAGETGWAAVDPGTLATRVEGVYAIGDVCGIKLANGMMLPKAGVFAHAHAEVVADEIAAAIAGRSSPRRFDGHGTCFLDMGNGVAGLAVGDFYAAPAPDVRMRPPSRLWHWGKVAFEKWWLRRWF